VPKNTLLCFSNNGLFNYLDTKQKRVCGATAASFLTKENYYLQDVEQFLQKKFETKMGKIRELVDNFRVGQNSTFNIDHRLSKFARDAIAIQSIRNPDYCRKHVLPGTPNKPQGRLGARYMANRILNDKDFSEVCNRGYNFSSRYTQVLINRTDSDFFLPSLHFYTVTYKGSEGFVLILSPKSALVLIEKDIYEKYHIDMDGPYYPEIRDLDELDKMNIACIEFEQMYGMGKIIGNKSELNRIGTELGIINSDTKQQSIGD